VVSFTPRPLYPWGKSSWYPLDRRLGGPKSRSGRIGEEKNYQPLPGLENSHHPARSPAIYNSDERRYAQSHMRSIRQTLRGQSVLPRTKRNRAVLLRRLFTTLWKSEIHINLKIDADALNRRRRRLCVRRTVYHIYQGE
jgi:hypothetical protein